MAEFRCPSCQKSYKWNKAIAGRTLQCLACQSDIAVPVRDPSVASQPASPSESAQKKRPESPVRDAPAPRRERQPASSKPKQRPTEHSRSSVFEPSPLPKPKSKKKQAGKLTILTSTIATVLLSLLFVGRIALRTMRKMEQRNDQKAAVQKPDPQQNEIAPPAGRAPGRFDRAGRGDSSVNEASGSVCPTIDSGKYRLVTNSDFGSRFAPATLEVEIHYRFNQPRSPTDQREYGLALTINGHSSFADVRLPTDEGVIRARFDLGGVRALSAPPQANLSNMSSSNNLNSNTITLEQVN